MKKLFILIITALYCLSAVQAQVPSRVSIAGRVTDADTEKAVPLATVVVKELGRWGTTDNDGYFSIKGIPAGSYTMEISLLGYEKREFALNLTGDITDGRWTVREQSLKLQEVVMTASSGKGITTSSRIEQQALEHVQPSSIRDVLQLLPGNLTQNPTLKEVNRLTIRSINNNDPTNALGVALIVNGANVSNDANMQVLKSGVGTNESNNSLASTAGTGIDARQIPTDNIESIEVISGIASAEYGDMTSGAVIVRTKAGVTPWSVRFKTDPLLKQVALGKGFGLGKKSGALNFNLDYSLSQSDPRTPSENFDRITGGVAYSNNFNNKVTFNAILSANYAKASLEDDPDNFANNIAMERNIGANLNINGRWTISKSWITNLEYLVAGNLGQQYSREKKFRTTGRVNMSSALSSGENIGFYTAPQYYSDIRIDGMPVDLQAKLTANLYGKYGKILNKVLLGAEFTTQGNNGKGKSFNPYNPPDITGSRVNTLRDRSYKDIPFLTRLTFFAGDKLTLPIGPTNVEIEAGIRISGIVPSDKFSMSEHIAVEPRFNMRYVIIKQHDLIKELAIRGGWGLHYKMPSMVYLYPEPAYLDMPSYAYSTINDNGYALAVFTTKRVDKTNNPDLKLQRNEKIDIALDFTVGKIFGNVVFFHEKLTNGYGFSRYYEPFYYTRYGYTMVNGRPTETDIVPGGNRPVYYVYDNNGTITRDVFVNGRPLAKMVDTTFIDYQVPQNSIKQTKWGIEYTLNLGTIKAINTSININGAYINIRRENTALTSLARGSAINGQVYPFIAIFGGNANSSNGSIDERLNTNLSFITHIPKIRMAITLGVQMVFIDRSRNISEYDGEILTYFIDENGIKHSGKEAYTNTQYPKKVDPLYVMDKKGVILPYAEARALYPNFDFSPLPYPAPILTSYLRQGYPFYGMLNLRVTKEIGNLATVSFYANNFMNILGRVKNDVTGYPQDKNTSLYFGAEVKLTF